MVEFIAALFVGTQATGILAGTSVIITGPAATGLAAGGFLSSFSPAAAGLFGAGGSFTALGVAKGAFGLLSSASDFVQGAQIQQGENLDAEEAELRGLEEGNRIGRLAFEQEALNNASTRSAGLTLQGSAGRIQEELQFDAERQLSVVRSGTRREAARRRQRGKIAFQRGVASGVGKLFKLVS